MVESIQNELSKRILILDGAMGTMIQNKGLVEKDYLGTVFSDWPVAMRGNNDVLNLTRPDVIKNIHQAYIDAGADIISTNTFSSNVISQHEYKAEEFVGRMAEEGARIAKQVASKQSKKVWVAGSMGPTSKSLTMAPDMNHPEVRSVDFEQMQQAYYEQASALIRGGADMLLLETCYDALNTKAALYAISLLNRELGRHIDVMVSATINDRSGRTLTGQTLEAFFASIAHYGPLSFGLNCSFGVEDLMPFMRQIAQSCPVYTSVYPNAGLPNEMGEYDEMPDFTAHYIRQMGEEGILNIAGGCCGTTPDHIRAITEALKGITPRQLVQGSDKLTVSGLEAVTIDKATRNFVNVGERTNVAGSRKFARLIRERKFDEALSVASAQIENGAEIIDVNMDDAMLDSRQSMREFLRYIASEPSVAKAALMIDSSDWPTIVEGLRNCQGKCIVNSISLKNGEAEFLSHAEECQRMGAAVVVMAFDEKGQATSYERKIEVCERAYKLLVGKIGFRPSDIIFDCNVLSIGTGIAEHANYAVDFIRAVEWIKNNLPGALTSGGISNLSFSFRGNNVVREAMHSVFLYYAIQKGLDMGIVNPGMLQVYDDIEPHLLKAVEDVIFNRNVEATDKLIDLANEIKNQQTDDTSQQKQQLLWRSGSVDERIKQALVRGTGEYLDEDIPEAMKEYGGNPVKVIEGPLMAGMEHVGDLFGSGKMFLPQVVKSARIMKQAVDILQLEIEKMNTGNESASKPKVVLATVKGDVHDIGKNIVAIVLSCNNFDVIDLGVMVPNEKILETVKREKPLFVGVNGLITPSLKEMENLCLLFESEHMAIPIFVGGATTSAVHTAVKLAPLYSHGVFYGGDASNTSVMAKKLTYEKDDLLKKNEEEQQVIRQSYHHTRHDIASYSEANKLAPQLSFDHGIPALSDLKPLENMQITLQSVESLIDWRMLLAFWGFRGESLQQLLVNPEASKTLDEAKETFAEAMKENTIEIRPAIEFRDAHREGNDIVLSTGTHLPMLRSQSKTGRYMSLADFFPEKGVAPIALFCIAVYGHGKYETKSYEALMQHALCARVAEASAVYMQSLLPAGINAIRPAFGYATCPDQSLKLTVFNEIKVTEKTGATLTDSLSIVPHTSICGLMLMHPEARYFPIGHISKEQLDDYILRSGLSREMVLSSLEKNVE